ncbi:MAG: hypothetical protein PHD29_05070 [bacterium]|nr:hypothetical protein [bacterium]
MRNSGRLLLMILIQVTFLNIPLVLATHDEMDQEIIDEIDLLMDYEFVDNLDLMEHYDVLFTTVPVEADGYKGETDENN